jgi:hypothetical protein
MHNLSILMISRVGFCVMGLSLHSQNPTQPHKCSVLCNLLEGYLRKLWWSDICHGYFIGWNGHANMESHGYCCVTFSASLVLLDVSILVFISGLHPWIPIV